MFVSSAVVFALSFIALTDPGPTPTALVAQIQHPPPRFKLRPGDRTAVQIAVNGGIERSLQWSLSLRRGDESETTLAAGNGGVAGAAVAELVADVLYAGEKYMLVLTASDKITTSEAKAEIQATAPTYSVIPLDEGNWSEVRYQVYGSDATGDRLFYAGPSADPMPILLMDRATGQRELLRVAVWSTESVRLNGDGSRLFYNGAFPPPAGPPPQGISGLGFMDITSRELAIIHADGGDFYSTDATGRRAAYQAVLPDATLQYFLYDESTGSRQLTDDPQAIRQRVARDDCPQILGTRPFISADGATVVIVTKATLGLVPADDTLGCRVFAYNVENNEWRQAAALPQSIVVDVPTLSADGQWLSFRARFRPGIPQSALLLNLQTGELHDPVVDVGPFATADSVVTGDGRGIVISTQADLDPRVGNADHNLELFYYDLATREVRQITETIEGIGRTPGGCPSYRPFVSRDGGVLTFFFHVFSVEACHLDGPMRHERDGFVFRFVRAVRRRPGNRGPVFAPIADQRVPVGDTLNLSLSASDPDGDPISFFAQVKDGTDVPPGSMITDHHDGTASFTWPTRPENAGTTVLRVAAFDEGGGEVVQDVTLTVVASDRSPLPSATTTPVPLPTLSPSVLCTCPSDCNGNGEVVINELLTATSIALGQISLKTCPAASCGSGDTVTIACLTRAVAAALNGCP